MSQVLIKSRGHEEVESIPKHFICDVSSKFVSCDKVQTSLVAKHNNTKWMDIKDDVGERYYSIFNNIIANEHLKIYLYTHLSIAYYVGLLYGPCLRKQGVREPAAGNLSLIGFSSQEFVINSNVEQKASDLVFCENGDGNSNESKEALVILEIGKDKKDAVKSVAISYSEQKLKFSKWCRFVVDKNINNGDELVQICREIMSNLPQGVDIHIFANCPAALMFLIGGEIKQLKKVHLYEYNATSDLKYSPSFILP